MDITKELKAIELSAEDSAKIIAQICEMEDELRKKEHLNRVVCSIYELDEAIKSGFFKAHNVGYVEVAASHEYSGDYKALLIQVNNNNNTKEYISDFIESTKRELTKSSQFLQSLTEYIGLFYPDLCNNDIISKFQRDSIELNSDAKDKILNILLSEELMQLKNHSQFDQSSIKEDIEKIVIEREQLKDKFHVLRVVALSHELNRLVDQDFFKNLDMHSIGLSVYFSYEDGHILSFDSINKNECVIKDSDYDTDKRITFLKDLFSCIKELNDEFISEDLMENNFLNLNNDVGQKVIELFLSPRLKAELDYNIMEAYLPEHNASSSKKIKV